METKKKYWKGLAQLNDEPVVNDLINNEFREHLPIDEFLGNKEITKANTSRRDFLKFLGFSTAAATLAACETPVVKSIPYLVKPDEIIPGVANYYASTIFDGRDFASVLVKTREGRPIKIENNNSCSNARVQASVLSLYDSSRLKYPLINGKQANWSTVDSEIKNKLADLNGKKIVLLSSTIISPTTKELIKDFTKFYSNVEHVVYDSISHDGILNANQIDFGLRAMPHYHFDKTNLIVSFGADFLGNWGSTQYSKDYVKGRNPKNGKMSQHYQFETNLSLTGANADYRTPIKPSEQEDLLYKVYQGVKGVKVSDKRISVVVDKLKENKGKSIVVCDSNSTNTQQIVNAINHELNNYNNTININKPDYLKQGNNNELLNLIDEMNKGQIGALIIHGSNPVYTYVNSKEFTSALSNVELKVSTSIYLDETASLMNYVCPDHHNLESWGDANPAHEKYTLMQPTIRPLFNTRQFQDTLLEWCNRSDYQSYLQSYWMSKSVDWHKSLHDGYFDIKERELNLSYKKPNSLSPKKSVKNSSGNLELSVYETIGIGDGLQANNPWLQEFPDPITRACWDNYLTISPSTADKLGLKNWNVSNGGLNGDIVLLKTKDIELKVPVLIQPGQAKDTLGIAVGYGREKAGKAGNNVGVNAFPLLNTNTVTITKTGEEHEFASIQLHHTMMDRNLVKETTLKDFIKNPSSGNKRDKYYYNKEKVTGDKITFYDDHDLETGHFWNLSIDLTSCTGCGECVISCQAENNIPVVGKEEIRRSRDMAWIRIDRYYSSDMTKKIGKEQGLSAVKTYAEMEEPSENPEVVFQPVMCQHCNHAPCENVCPVAATTHSNEGLNQMTYNRCVGTRYCANNCPYKVRRFNWFQYSDNDKFDFNMNDDLGKMVLNPDVVVRSRGVIEKCSMCIQKIQALKLKAKNSGQPIKDEDAQTVCASSCSTNAIVFGDRNDKQSEVSKLRNDERAYDLLDHLNVRPSVFYQTKIRNK